MSFEVSLEYVYLLEPMINYSKHIHQPLTDVIVQLINNLKDPMDFICTVKLFKYT